MRKGMLIFIAALAGVGITGVATSRRSLPGGRVQVMFTLRVNGAMAPCGCAAGQYGGMPRRATAVERERLPGDATLLLDAGNFIGQRVALSRFGFSDPYAFHELHNMALARGMDLLGYDAANLGELDFQVGETLLRRIASETGLPLISSNISYMGFSRS